MSSCRYDGEHLRVSRLCDNTFSYLTFSYCPGGPDSDFEYSTQSYTGYEVSRLMS